jgi:metallopeptidase MepB
MATLAFKNPPQAPPAWTATKESLVKDTQSLIDKSRSLLNKLVAEIKPETASFENVCLPQVYNDNDFGDQARIIGFYQAVSSSAELRDASTQAEQLMNDYDVEASMREDVFKLIEAVKNRGEKLDPESQYFLDKEYKHYIQNGLGLPSGPKRNRFKEIKKRLSDIATIFQKNLNEETGGVWFTEKELEGLPQDTKALLKKGEGENEGKLWLTFKYPDLFPTMKYVKNGDVRKKYIFANENKCPQNVPLFQETIILRDEAARLLGYPDHASYRIEDKMAKTPKTVNDFLGDLRTRLTPGGKQELENLRLLKIEDLKERGTPSEDERYYLWDNQFYNTLLLEREYALDQNKIAEYFPLETSIRGMLQIFEHLFGMVFYELKGKDRDAVMGDSKGSTIGWHEEVQVFSVWDDEGEGGEFVGYLYLDLFPRDGKYGHAANFNIQPGYLRENGTRHYPCTALVCNFSKPTPKKPSLLKHDEVVTLFHELGHGIHDLVSRTRYSRFHGTSTVRDFVEAPSQMLENWCWTPSQIKALSQHYSYLSPEYLAAWKESVKDDKEIDGSVAPPERIPDELVSSIVKSEHVNDAIFNLRQLHFGIFDMTVHQPKSHEEVEKLDITGLFNRLRKDITLTDGPEVLGEGYNWGHGQSTFGHLLGGYDAGYYGYLR